MGQFRRSTQDRHLDYVSWHVFTTMFEENNTIIVRKMDAYSCRQRRRMLSSAGIEVPSS
jgi:hypothetical protein